MKRLALVAALLSAGCDDPAVQERVASVMQHGMVQAQVKCLVNAVTFCPCSTCQPSPIQFSAAAHLFQDSSSLVVAAGALSFNSAGEPVQSSTSEYNLGIDRTVLEFRDGLLDVKSTCANSNNVDQLLDLSTDATCTGFNLEAFGIEE